MHNTIWGPQWLTYTGKSLLLNAVKWAARMKENLSQFLMIISRLSIKYTHQTCISSNNCNTVPSYSSLRCWKCGGTSEYQESSSGTTDPVHQSLGTCCSKMTHFTSDKKMNATCQMAHFFPKGPSSWVGDPWHMMYTVLIQSASSCFKTTSRTLPNFRRTFATSRFQVSNYLLQTTDFCLMTFLVGWHKTTTKQRFWRSCIACALKLEYYTLQTNYSV